MKVQGSQKVDCSWEIRELWRWKGVHSCTHLGISWNPVLEFETKPSPPDRQSSGATFPSLSSINGHSTPMDLTRPGSVSAFEALSFFFGTLATYSRWSLCTPIIVPSHHFHKFNLWLVVTGCHFLHFPMTIGNLIILIDELIFFRGVETKNQIFIIVIFQPVGITSISLDLSKKTCSSSL